MTRKPKFDPAYLAQLKTAVEHYRADIAANGWTVARARLLRTAEDYFMLEHGKQIEAEAA